MKTLIKLFTQPDKLLHLIAGALITLYSFALLVAARVSPTVSAILANVLAVAALLGKKLYDKHHPDTRTAEWADLIAGIAGALLVDGAIIIM